MRTTKYSQSRQPNYRFFEVLKRQIQQQNLTPAEYDAAIRKAARKAGV